MSKILKDINSFQDKAVDTILFNTNKKIIIKSAKFTGKSMIALKLFKKSNNEVTIYHTGCCPELFSDAKSELFKILNDYKDKNLTLILDEFYDQEILGDISHTKNFNCYVLTNDLKLSHEAFKVFNYLNFYKKFINNEFGKYLNLHEVLNDDFNFSKKNEYLRHYSKSTSVFVKENDDIKEFRLEV